MRKALLILIHGYQWLLRPLLPASCRFYPSCSCYAHEAISRNGAWRGFQMTVSRLSRCHPWNPGGYDPVDPPLVTTPTQPETTPARLISRLN